MNSDAVGLEKRLPHGSHGAFFQKRVLRCELAVTSVDHAGLLALAQAAGSALVAVVAVDVAVERVVAGERRFAGFPRHGPPEEALRQRRTNTRRQ